MAQVLYADGIKTVRGALDSIKDSQAQRARWISRLRWQGEKSIAPDGSIWHEFYRMHMHDGAWSEGATRNREMIKAYFLPAAHTTCELLRRWVCDRRGNGKNGYSAPKRSQAFRYL